MKTRTSRITTAVVTYQNSAGDLNYQLSAFGRDSSVHFTPDPVGDLYFNGVASDVDRRLGSLGLQGDASYALGAGHTLRAGFTRPRRIRHRRIDDHRLPGGRRRRPDGPGLSDRRHAAVSTALFAGAYLQDEWKLSPRPDAQLRRAADDLRRLLRPRGPAEPAGNLIYKATHSTTLHAGYSRYFTPPPVENVPGGTVAQFNGTSNAVGRVTEDDPVKAERSDYLDAGISQKLAAGFQRRAGRLLQARQNQLDDGLFGQTLILSAFNYAQGEVYGLELTGFLRERRVLDAYANLAHSVAKGEGLELGPVPLRARTTWPMSRTTGSSSTTTRR